MKTTIFTSVLFIIVILNAAGQSIKEVKYVGITFIKSFSPDFVKHEIEFWNPVHETMVYKGRKAAWYLNKIKYPSGTKTTYE